jgi:hypothetical protein
VDPDSTYHPDADPDHSFQIKAQSLEKVLKHVHSGFLFDADPDADPGYQNDADLCGSGSTTLIFINMITLVYSELERKGRPTYKGSG